MELSDFLIDPRPELKNDSHRWERLFRIIFLTIPDLKLAERLLRRMWAMRAFGMTMKRDLQGIKFIPIIRRGAAWETQEEYEQMKATYITPLIEEIKILIRKVEEQTD